MTKKYKRAYRILSIMSILLNVAAPFYYIIEGLFGKGIIVEKIALSSSIFIVLILSIVAYINKTTMRSRIWILLLGLYICLDHFITPLLIIAITQIFDEWIVNPLSKNFKMKFEICKQIDNRMNYV